MSTSESRRVRARVNKDQELVGFVKKLLEGLLNDGNADLSLVEDGTKHSTKEISEIPPFNTVEFEFEYYKHETYELYEQLTKKCSDRGEGFGLLERYIDEYNAHIDAYGDVGQIEIDLTSCDDRWVTDVPRTVTLQLSKGKACELMGIEESSESKLEEELKTNASAFLVALFGEELTEAIFPGEIEEQPDINIDEMSLVFYPYDDGWCFGTADEFAKRKGVFERAAAIMKGIGGTIDIYWEDVTDDPSEFNSFVSEDGFKAMWLKTEPNHWDGFRAIEYEL